MTELKLKPLDKTIDEWWDRTIEEFSIAQKRHLKCLIKLRVEWILEKIEKEIEKREKERRYFGRIDAYDLSYSEAGEISGLKFTENLIKKAFEGVINND